MLGMPARRRDVLTGSTTGAMVFDVLRIAVEARATAVAGMLGSGTMAGATGLTAADVRTVLNVVEMVPLGWSEVVLLQKVIAADPQADAAALGQLGQQIGQQMTGDLVDQLVASLQTRYGVTINRRVIEERLK